MISAERERIETRMQREELAREKEELRERQEEAQREEQELLDRQKRVKVNCSGREFKNEKTSILIISCK